VTACLVVVLALLVWELSQGSFSLAFLVPYFEEAVRGDPGGWRLSIGELVPLPDLKLHARNVDLLGADGQSVLQVPDIVVRPSLRAILHGIAAVRTVEIDGAAAHIVRRADGSFGVSIAEPAAVESDADDAGEQLLANLLEPLSEDSAIGFLRRFHVTNAALAIRDLETDASWKIENADLDLQRGEEGHQLIVRAAVMDDAGGVGAQIHSQLEVRAQGSGFTIDGSATVADIEVSRLPLYWPQNAAAPARRWVIENIQKGNVNEVELGIGFASDVGTDFHLSKLQGRMRYENLEVRWSDDAPAVTSVAGTSTFDASSMRFSVSGATSGGINVTSGRVALLDLDTNKERIAIEVKGRGAMSAVVGFIPDTSKKLPFEMTGDTDLEVQTSFPLSSKLSFDDVSLKVDSDPRSVRVRHKVADASVSGRLRYQKKPRQRATLTADLDLTGARLHDGGFQWTQPKGKTGKVEFHLDVGEEPATFEMLRVDCPGLRAKGSVTVGGDGETSGSARLREVVYEATELDRLEAEWKPGGLRIRVGSGNLDLEPLLGDEGNGNAGAGAEKPIDLDLQTGELRRVSFDQDSWLENVRATAVRRDGGWKQIDVRGELPKALWTTGPSAADPGGKKTMSVRLAPVGPGWRLEAGASDFGSLLRAVNVSDDVRGGMLEISGRADKEDRGHVLRAHVKATNFFVLDAPLMVRVLTVASLDRFVSTMRGEGLQFDAVKGTVVVRGDRYELENVRAHGSAIGWTAAGWIDTGTDKLQIEGAVIPAYQANKMLRKIPILRDLLLGADQRGLIAINYKVRGGLQDPQVSTNPLSALTPGFLREVWEIGK